MPGTDLVVAVLTYRRVPSIVALLPVLVEQLAACRREHGLSGRVVVVDNDPEAAARDAVAGLGLAEVAYLHEPAPGIAHGRNRALQAAADARLLAFIDDDEQPSPEWLSALVGTWRTTDAAAVTGPVLPRYLAEPDPWITAGGFFVRQSWPDAATVPAASTGNLLLDLDRVRDADLRFDARFGLVGGSDTLFTRTLAARPGNRLVWSAAAAVHDEVPASRLSRRWVLRRAFRSGNSWTRTSLALARSGRARLGIRVRSTVRGLPRLVLGAARAAAGTVTRSPRQQARGARTVARGLGILSGAFGVEYAEYARRPPAPGAAGTTPAGPLVRRLSVRRAASSAHQTVRRARSRRRARRTVPVLEQRNRTSRDPVLGDAPVTVSLTSFGSRIAAVYLTVESIAAGTVRPERLVLWLDDAAVVQDPPEPLARLVRRGLELRHTADLGPHKKYYPALPDAIASGHPLATADDDVLYPQTWLAGLLAAHTARPDAVHCYRASEVVVQGDRLAPYDQWPRCHDTVASLRHLATGVSGVIYPTALLTAVAARGEQFLDHCARADDLWLHWNAVQAGIPVAQVDPVPRHFPLLPGSQQTSLTAVNVAGGGNDAVFAALYSAADRERLRTASH